LDSSDFSCFWQESVLPEGPAAKALQEMTKPKRIAITDSFWLDLSCGKHQTCTFEVAWASEILGLYPHLKINQGMQRKKAKVRTVEGSASRWG